MWEDIDFKQDTTQDLRWVAEQMQSNTLVWTTDGSYDRKQATALSGMGWIIFCTRTGFHMTGMFWKKITISQLVQGGNPLTMRSSPSCAGGGRFFQHTPMGISTLVQQQMSTGAVIPPSAKDTTKCKMHLHKTQLLCHQAGLHWGVSNKSIYTDIWINICLGINSVSCSN